MDPFFKEGKFLKGADNALKMYYESLKDGDEEFLEDFLAPRLMDETRDFLESKPKNLKLVDKVKTSSIVNADIKGRTAFVDVMFDVSFDDSSSEKVIWTLARPVDSDDPNWDLDQIQKPS
jgi:predicted lipid-binding transport protein (Tim44 family)